MKPIIGLIWLAGWLVLPMTNGWAETTAQREFQQKKAQLIQELETRLACVRKANSKEEVKQCREEVQQIRYREQYQRLQDRQNAIEEKKRELDEKIKSPPAK